MPVLFPPHWFCLYLFICMQICFMSALATGTSCLHNSQHSPTSLWHQSVFWGRIEVQITHLSKHLNLSGAVCINRTDLKEIKTQLRIYDRSKWNFWHKNINGMLSINSCHPIQPPDICHGLLSPPTVVTSAYRFCSAMRVSHLGKWPYIDTM